MFLTRNLIAMKEIHLWQISWEIVQKIKVHELSIYDVRLKLQKLAPVHLSRNCHTFHVILSFMTSWFSFNEKKK